MRVYARQGDTLDALCWRHLGRTAGVVEAALEANPGLADLGPMLPHGTAVDLPDPTSAAPARRALIQLWD
mgnify:CR=1 FL=1